LGVLESEIEKLFKKRVEKIGGIAIKLVAVKGCPDRLVILPNNTMQLVELKTDTGVLSPMQVYFHKKLAKLGVSVKVVRGKEGVENYGII